MAAILLSALVIGPAGVALAVLAASGRKGLVAMRADRAALATGAARQELRLVLYATGGPGPYLWGRPRLAAPPLPVLPPRHGEWRARLAA